MAFDTLTYARRLKQAGVPEAQAEAMADATRELVVQDFATKGDIAAVKTDLAAVKTDLAAVKTDLAVVKTDLAVVKTDLAVVKTDLAVVKTDLAAMARKTDLAALDQRLTAAMDTLGLRLTVRMGGLIAVGVAVLAAIIKL
jgi:septal ring factor EnvC (AmiA/AmiB activator)